MDDAVSKVRVELAEMRQALLEMSAGEKNITLNHKKLVEMMFAFLKNASGREE